MKIELFPLAKLKLLVNNPCRITKDQMKKLCKSIQDDPEFLFNRPVLVNCVTTEKSEKIYHVYAGNQRVRAAKNLKLKEIPCIIEHELSEEILKRRIVLDNKTFGVFDFDILANEWDVEMLLDLGFTNIDLQLDSMDTVDNEEPKNIKKKTCPHCGEII